MMTITICADAIYVSVSDKEASRRRRQRFDRIENDENEKGCFYGVEY